jgi:hypothetical protein
MMMADVRAWRKEMKANPEEIESESEYRDIPTEEAAVENFRTLKKLHKNQLLVSGRHGKSKEWS